MIFTTIKEEYQSTKTSFKKLAKKHQIHYKKIERMAKKEGWIKYDPTKAPTTNIQTIEPPQKTIKQTESIQSILNRYMSCI